MRHEHSIISCLICVQWSGYGQRLVICYLSVQDAITTRVHHHQYGSQTAIPTSSSGPITPIQILPPVDDGLINRMNIGTRTRQSPSTSKLVGFLWLHQLVDLGSNPTLSRSLFATSTRSHLAIAIHLELSPKQSATKPPHCNQPAQSPLLISLRHPPKNRESGRVSVAGPAPGLKYNADSDPKMPCRYDAADCCAYSVAQSHSDVGSNVASKNSLTFLVLFLRVVIGLGIRVLQWLSCSIEQPSILILVSADSVGPTETFPLCHCFAIALPFLFQ